MRRRTALCLVLPAFATLGVAPPATAVPSCEGRPATLFGGSGHDTVVGTPLGDVVWLGPGNDRFSGAGGDDIVCAGPGNDTLFGDDGDDRVYGEAGNDYVGEGSGNDTVDGGTGSDWLSYRTWHGGVTVDTPSGAVTGAGTDRALRVETYEGSTLADVLRGGSGHDDLRGGSGADQIFGYGGADYLSASGGTIRAGAGTDFVSAAGDVVAWLGAGTDSAYVVSGRSHIIGGPGGDFAAVVAATSQAVADMGPGINQLSFLRVGRSVTANLGAGVATWNGGRLTFSGVHNVIGSRRADVMLGSARGDVLFGKGGDDVLRGRGGNDAIQGGSGRDEAYGGNGADTCVAEARRGCEY